MSRTRTARDVHTRRSRRRDVAVRNGTEIVLDSKDGADVEAFLLRYGSRIRSFAVEEPSLESVFLSLTGRELRE